jgi:membrane protein implicated in regulation of membrane protease activity
MQNHSSPKHQRSAANDSNGLGHNVVQALVFTWYGELAFWTMYAVSSTFDLSWWLSAVAALLGAAAIVFLVKH